MATVEFSDSDSDDDSSASERSRKIKISSTSTLSDGAVTLRSLFASLIEFDFDDAVDRGTRKQLCATAATLLNTDGEVALLAELITYCSVMDFTE